MEHTPEEWLGQVLIDGKWMDYARGHEAESRRWQAGDPVNRRLVHWISGDVLVANEPEPEVAPCRTCGTAIYLAHRSDGPQVGGTGQQLNEHWRHIEGDERYCERGNGAIAEPYDGGGPLAEALRAIRERRGQSEAG